MRNPDTLPINCRWAPHGGATRVPTWGVRRDVFRWRRARPMRTGRILAFETGIPCVFSTEPIGVSAQWIAVATTHGRRAAPPAVLVLSSLVPTNTTGSAKHRSPAVNAPRMRGESSSHSKRTNNESGSAIHVRLDAESRRDDGAISSGIRASLVSPWTHCRTSRREHASCIRGLKKRPVTS